MILLVVKQIAPRDYKVFHDLDLDFWQRADWETANVPFVRIMHLLDEQRSRVTTSDRGDEGAAPHHDTAPTKNCYSVNAAISTAQGSPRCLHPLCESTSPLNNSQQ